MKGAKALSKGAIADALGSSCEMKKSAAGKVLDALSELVAKEVKSTGKFTIPGVCMVKTRNKPAQKAGKRIAFGKEVTVKARPARTIVKAFPVKALMLQESCNAGLRGALAKACERCFAHVRFGFW